MAGNKSQPRIFTASAALLFLILGILSSACTSQMAETSIMAVAKEENIGQPVVLKGKVISVQPSDSGFAYQMEDSLQNRILVMSGRKLSEGSQVIIRGTLYRNENVGFYIKE